jgi:hypothetical protein
VKEATSRRRRSASFPDAIGSEPLRRIPVSETGYRSYFAPIDEVEASSSPQDYARDVVLGILRSRQPVKRFDRDQLSLF